MGEYLSLSEVLKLTVFSMLVVFVCLLVISYIIDVLRVLLNGRPKKVEPVQRVEEKPVSLDVPEDEFLILAFTAAIAASSGKSPADLHIRQIRKIS